MFALLLAFTVNFAAVEIPECEGSEILAQTDQGGYTCIEKQDPIVIIERATIKIYNVPECVPSTTEYLETICIFDGVEFLGGK